MDSYNELVYNKVLPPEQKGYRLRNPPTFNYSNNTATQHSMGRNSLIVDSNELHSVTNAYIKVVNNIATFARPTPPTNIITNDTTMTQYSIKKGIGLFGKKVKAAV